MVGFECTVAPAAGEQEELHAARLYVYGLFQRAFCEEPDEALTTSFMSPLAERAFEIVAQTLDREEARPFSEAFLRCRDRASLATSSVYTRLFVGPGKLFAPPWESLYRTKTNALFQQSTLAVRQFYAENGVQAQGYPRVADDHLAIELDFMKVLCVRLLAAYEDEDLSALSKIMTAQKTFLDEHLLRWVGDFATRLLAYEKAVFYSECALALKCFLQVDRLVLENVGQSGVLRGRIRHDRC